MNEVTVKIQTTNAAFDFRPGEEVARILRALAYDVEIGGAASGALRDYNGNTVGTVTIR